METEDQPSSTTSLPDPFQLGDSDDDDNDAEGEDASPSLPEPADPSRAPPTTSHRPIAPIEPLTPPTSSLRHLHDDPLSAAADSEVALDPTPPLLTATATTTNPLEGAAGVLPSSKPPTPPSKSPAPQQAPSRASPGGFVPPPPRGDVDADAALGIEVPALCSPSLFLAIPDADPLTVLLAKYIPNPEHRPRRDVSGDYSRSDFETLMMTNSWRALAKWARDRIVVSNPLDVSTILNLWALRLASLARLRLYNHASAETSALFSALATIQPPAVQSYILKSLLPVELELARARTRYWSGNLLGYVNALVEVLMGCRRKARACVARLAASTDVEEMQRLRVSVDEWKRHTARVGLVLASQLVEMKQFATATRLLEPLCHSKSGDSPELHSALAYIHLQSGNLDGARVHLEAANADASIDPYTRTLNSLLRAAAYGEWDYALKVLEASMATATEDVQQVIDANNMAVILLNQGKLAQAISILEKATENAPSTAVIAEPFLFNLATLYELRTHTAMEKKRALLIEVAKWSGDGLRPTALKLP